MARIQSKRSGKKPRPERIRPLEIKRHAEEALTRLGSPSKSWKDYSSKPPPSSDRRSRR